MMKVDTVFQVLSDPSFFKDVQDYLYFWTRPAGRQKSKCGVCEFMMDTEEVEVMKKIKPVCEFIGYLPKCFESVPVAWYLIKTHLGLSTQVAVNKLQPSAIFKHLLLKVCEKREIEKELEHACFFHTHDYVKKSEDGDDDGPPKKKLKTHSDKSDVLSDVEDFTGGDDDDECGGGKKKKYTEGEIRYMDLHSSLMEWFKKQRQHCCEMNYKMNNSLKVNCLHANCGDLSSSVAAKSLPIDTRDMLPRIWLDKKGIDFTEYTTQEDMYGAGQVGVRRTNLGGAPLTNIPLGDGSSSRGDIVSKPTTVSQPCFFNSMFHIETGDPAKTLVSDNETAEERNKRIDIKQEKMQVELMQAAGLIYKIHLLVKKIKNEGDFVLLYALLGEPCLSCAFMMDYRLRACVFSLANESRAHMLKVKINTSDDNQQKIYNIPMKRRRDPHSGKFLSKDAALDPDTVLRTEDFNLYNANYEPTLKQKVDCITSGVDMLGEEAVRRVAAREDVYESNKTISSTGIDTNDYSYDFMGEQISYTAFSRAFGEWRRKFPFFPKTKSGKEEEEFKIAMHAHIMPLSSPKIWCYTNPRVCAVESNLHTTTSLRCDLPLKVRLGEILCKVNKKQVSLIKNGIGFVTNYHGMKYELSMIDLL